MTEQYQSIKFSVVDRVARVTFARPPLNVFNIAMMNEIGEALNECVPRRDVVVIVFDAVRDARAFSAGVAAAERQSGTTFHIARPLHYLYLCMSGIAHDPIPLAGVA